MKKDKFFRNCPKVENNKIHITDVAKIQETQKISDDDHLIANSGFGSLGAESLENILTSLNAMDKQPFHKMKLDELYLHETKEIHSKTLNLISRFNLLSIKLASDTDTFIHLSQLLTDALLLGNKIGVYNESVENIQALRDNETIKKSQSAGGDKSNELNNRIKRLVFNINNKMKSDKRIYSAPIPDKALATFNLLAKYRQESLATSTLQEYFSEAMDKKSKGGRPPKGKPTPQELSQWMNDNFSADEVNEHFIKLK